MGDDLIDIYLYIFKLSAPRNNVLQGDLTDRNYLPSKAQDCRVAGGWVAGGAGAWLCCMEKANKIAIVNLFRVYH